MRVHSREADSCFITYIGSSAANGRLVGSNHQDQPVKNNGVIYIQLGGGGGNRSYRPKNPDLRWAKTYQGYGYSMFWIHGDHLAYAMYDDRGAMRDYFSMTR